jgi:UDPglucose 6-dehydrogenase
LVAKNIVNGNLSFSDNLSEGIKKDEVVYIAVGTPSREDG